MTNEQKREQVKIALQSGFRVKITPLDFSEPPYTLIGYIGDRWEFVDNHGTRRNILPHGDFNFEILPRLLPELKVGQKVKVIYSHDIDTNTGDYKVENSLDSDGQVFVRNESGYAVYVPVEWLCPVIEEEPRETFEFGGQLYDKAEFEEAVKNLKPVTKES